jgi:N6-L-threonylcarbamoyladenine synthase
MEDLAWLPCGCVVPDYRLRLEDRKAMLVLGIETTCDETAAAVVHRHQDGGGEILSNVVLSQIADHAAYGGVVPEIAARAHVEALDTIIGRALEEAQTAVESLDGIAAAAGPGLIGGVIVGLTTAKAMALALGTPLVAINHLEAHALTPRLTDAVSFPYLLLLASGGHTQLVAVRRLGDYHRLGTTIDDAIGEAFDKTAKMLGLPYPGGPAVEHEAIGGNPSRFQLPRPMQGRQDPNFSLSGLKTAVRIEAQRIEPLTNEDVRDLCASFQAAVVDMIVDRTRAGLRRFRDVAGQPTCLVVAGGVAANLAIRRGLQRLGTEVGLRIVTPPPELCTDNGAMIAWAGAERLAAGLSDTLDVSPRARWPLDPRSAASRAKA